MPPNHRRRGALGCLAAATSILLALGTPASADINPGGINENRAVPRNPHTAEFRCALPHHEKGGGRCARLR